MFYNMAAQRLDGLTWPQIASNFGLTVDQASYRANKHKLFMQAFSRNEDNVLTLKGHEILYTGRFSIGGYLEVTGDEADGILYYTENKPTDYDYREFNYLIASRNSFDYPFIIGSLKVGKVVKVSLSKFDLKDFQLTSSLPSPTPVYVKKQETKLSNEGLEVDKDEYDYSKATWNASNKFISITCGRNIINANNSHPKFREALDHLFNDEISKAVNLINVEKSVKQYTKGHIKIENGILTFKGIEITNGLTNRIIKDMQDGKDFQFYLPFLNNLMLNPSNKAINRLFDFLEANDIEITKDGYFLAYKKITNDYKDIYSRTIDNSIGTLVHMERNLVNENDEVTCSYGLHVCSKSYLGNFFDYSNRGKERVVICKVHPRDVVAIPKDYNNAKMRTCQYEVIKEV